MYDFKGKTTLITGGSAGIGAAFAAALAQRGSNLVLVARTQAGLDSVASSLRDQHRVAVTTVQADLGRPSAPDEVLAQLQQRSIEVDVLINNVGVATPGPFAKLARDKMEAEIALNTSLVVLTHLLLPRLLESHGGIINVASTAAYQPVPGLAVYGATKAFVLSFSEALWAEHEDELRVVAVCPGPTHTPLLVRMSNGNPPPAAAPEDVVVTALAAFDRNSLSVIHGFANATLAFVSRLMPRAAMARMVRSTMRAPGEAR